MRPRHPIRFLAHPAIRVALLGLGLTTDQILAAGWSVVGIVIVGIIVTMLSGPLLTRIMNRGSRLGLLTGGAGAI